VEDKRRVGNRLSTAGRPGILTRAVRGKSRVGVPYRSEKARGGINGRNQMKEVLGDATYDCSHAQAETKL